MPKWGPGARAQEQDPEEQMRILEQWQAAFSAKYK
jgi:hypothetical protein